MKSLNIILANATQISGNRGCVALCITSIYLLDEIFSKKKTNYNIYLCDSGFSAFKEVIYKFPDKELKYTTCGYPLDFSIKENFKLLLKNELKKNINIFRSADYIFDIGQGDSFADIYGKNRFNKIDRIHKVARLYKKPYCLLPQTIGPFKDPKIKKIANKSIKDSSLVMARDKQSLDYIVGNVPLQKNVDEYIDVAFFMPYQKKTFDRSYIHVGLNVSALLWNGGYTRDNQFGLKVNYQELIYQIIDYFLSIENVKLHLIPHVVEGEKSIENDYEVSFEIYEKYSHHNLILSDFFLGPIEAKNYISGMDFFMGARMHSTIAAFSTGVPVVPMAYSRKFNGLFVDTLNYHHLADMKNENNLDVLETIKRSFTKRNTLKEEINNQLTSTVTKKKEKIQTALIKFLNL